MGHYFKHGNARLTSRYSGESPITFHNWRRRFLSEGLTGLEDRSRASYRLSVSTIPREHVSLVVSIRNENPACSKYNIAVTLNRDYAAEPSASSVGRILKRNMIYGARKGLNRRRAARKRTKKIRSEARMRDMHPDEVLQADTKTLQATEGRNRCPMRVGIVGVLIIMILVVVWAVTGCGGDTSQARQYMRQGDQLIPQLMKDAKQFEIQAANADFTDPATLASVGPQLKASAKEITNQVDKIWSYYKKIQSLKGVNNYLSYAFLRLEELELLKKMVSEVISIATTQAVPSLSQLRDLVTRYTAKIHQLDQDAEWLQFEKKL